MNLTSDPHFSYNEEQSLYWAQANVTPESASLPCSASALIKAVCSWIVCIEVLLMYMYTAACTCVYTCLWKLGVHIRCLLHCFPSCFLADAVDWPTSKPQGSSFCASPTQTTAVQSYQLLGSRRLNSDPHVCTSYTLWTKSSCQFHVLNELLSKFKRAIEIFLHISRNMPWCCHLYQFSSCSSFFWSHLPILPHSHLRSERGLRSPCAQSQGRFNFHSFQKRTVDSTLKWKRHPQRKPVKSLWSTWLGHLLKVYNLLWLWWSMHMLNFFYILQVSSKKVLFGW